MCMCSSEAVEMMCKKSVPVYLNSPYAYVESKQNQDIVRKIFKIDVNYCALSENDCLLTLLYSSFAMNTCMCINCYVLHKKISRMYLSCSYCIANHVCCYRCGIRVG